MAVRLLVEKGADVNVQDKTEDIGCFILEQRLLWRTFQKRLLFKSHPWRCQRRLEKLQPRYFQE